MNARKFFNGTTLTYASQSYAKNKPQRLLKWMGAFIADLSERDIRIHSAHQHTIQIKEENGAPILTAFISKHGTSTQIAVSLTFIPLGINDPEILFKENMAKNRLREKRLDIAFEALPPNIKRGHGPYTILIEANHPNFRKSIEDISLRAQKTLSIPTLPHTAITP